MTTEEATKIVNRMEEDTKQGAPHPTHHGHYPFLFGAFKERIRWILMLSDLKAENFDEKGNFIPFP